MTIFGIYVENRKPPTRLWGAEEASGNNNTKHSGE
jgi:hypothetical protein